MTGHKIMRAPGGYLVNRDRQLHFVVERVPCTNVIGLYPARLCAALADQIDLAPQIKAELDKVPL